MAVAESVAPRRGCHRAVARTRSPCARYAAASPTASQSPPQRKPPPARPVRGRPRKADGYADRATGTAAVRYTSVDPAARRSAALHGDTRRTEETARLAENSQLAGRLRRWWQGLGSNQRRLSRRFYSPPSTPSRTLLISTFAAGSRLGLAQRHGLIAMGQGLSWPRCACGKRVGHRWVYDR